MREQKQNKTKKNKCQYLKILFSIKCEKNDAKGKRPFIHSFIPFLTNHFRTSKRRERYKQRTEDVYRFDDD